MKVKAPVWKERLGSHKAEDRLLVAGLSLKERVGGGGLQKQSFRIIKEEILEEGGGWGGEGGRERWENTSLIHNLSFFRKTRLLNMEKKKE